MRYSRSISRARTTSTTCVYCDPVCIELTCILSGHVLTHLSPRHFLSYPRADLASTVDHTDPTQSADFRALAAALFAAQVCVCTGAWMCV